MISCVGEFCFNTPGKTRRLSFQAAEICIVCAQFNNSVLSISITSSVSCQAIAFCQNGLPLITGLVVSLLLSELNPHILPVLSFLKCRRFRKSLSVRHET